jgi:uracil-DNA glycosylase family 4
MSEFSNILYLNFIKKIGISTFLQDKPNNFYKENIKQDKLVIPSKIDGILNLDQLEIFIKDIANKKFVDKESKIIIGHGNTHSNIMIIGESPNIEEINSGRLFCGPEGELLKKMLESIDIKKNDIYTTNIISWNYRKKDKEEMLNSLPFIQKIIEIINPKILVILGSETANIILNLNHEISKLRKKWHKYKSINLDKAINCLVTFSPKNLINSPNNKKYAWEDLKELKQKIINEKL